MTRLLVNKVTIVIRMLKWIRMFRMQISWNSASISLNSWVRMEDIWKSHAEDIMVRMKPSVVRKNENSTLKDHERSDSSISIPDRIKCLGRNNN